MKGEGKRIAVNRETAPLRRLVHTLHWEINEKIIKKCKRVKPQAVLVHVTVIFWCSWNSRRSTFCSLTFWSDSTVMRYLLRQKKEEVWIFASSFKENGRLINNFIKIIRKDKRIIFIRVRCKVFVKNGLMPVRRAR